MDLELHEHESLFNAMRKDRLLLLKRDGKS